MKYLVIGAGGTGGCIAGYMKRAGKDVSLIARGEHLKAIKENGLTIDKPNDRFTVLIPACTMEDYNETPDVIFVCVKGYSIDDVIPFIQRVGSDNTIVIPILNIYGTGGVMQKSLPNMLVTDGCIYIGSQIGGPGFIKMNGEIFRVVYGVRNKEEYRPELEVIETDLKDSGITPLLTDDIRRDALKKFSYVSPAATCGQYYDCNSDRMQVEGKERETLKSLIHEIEILAEAMGIDFGEDMVDTNLKILANLAPDSATSMQRDVRAGKVSEIDGLIHGVVRMGRDAGVELPTYALISEALKDLK